MKFEQVSIETFDLFEERFTTSSLDQVSKFAVVGSPKLKMNPLGLCGKVTKTSDVFKAALENKIGETPDFIFIINEGIFLQLDTPQQFLVIDKLIAQCGYDYEKDQPLIISPDVQEFSGILKNNDINTLEALKLSVESFYQKAQEDADSAPPKKRGRKKKNVDLD